MHFQRHLNPKPTLEIVTAIAAMNSMAITITTKFVVLFCILCRV